MLQTKKISRKIKDLQDDIISNNKLIEKNNAYIRDYEKKMTATKANVEKLRIKKNKTERDNEKLIAETQKKKDELTKAEEGLAIYSTSIKNVTDFK